MGGACYGKKVVSILLENCDFLNNFADLGSGIYMEEA